MALQELDKTILSTELKHDKHSGGMHTKKKTMISFNYLKY